MLALSTVTSKNQCMFFIFGDAWDYVILRIFRFIIDLKIGLLRIQDEPFSSILYSRRSYSQKFVSILSNIEH